MSPLSEIVKAIVDKRLSEKDIIDFAFHFANLLQKETELCRIIEHWPKLLVELKQVIFKLVR